MHAESEAPLDGAAPIAAASAPEQPRLLRLLGRLFWLAVALWFAFALIVVVAREVVLPRMNDYRDEIGARISAALGARVTIGHIDARWSGIRPYLDLGQVAVHDASDRVALELGLVRTSLSWMSIPFAELRLHHLAIDGPDLQVRRDLQGRVYVAGIELAGGGGSSGFANWLLAQHEIVVRNATVRWLDERRAAPELVLSNVNLRLVNLGARHRIGVTAEPPQAFAAPIDLRADIRGRDFSRLAEWNGQIYVDVERADLSAWRTWVDYPLDLPRGSGALTLWADLEGQRLAGFTGDLSLDDVQLRLREDLPMIDLVALRGRIAAKLPVDGLDLAATGLSLATRDDTRIKPLDLHVSWHAASQAAPARGTLTASEVDLAALAQLAGNLPFDAGTRLALQEFAPRGKVSDFKAGWTGDSEKLATWHGSARFADTALQARGLLPGFTAVSGSIEASHEGGSASISGRAATLDLPRVFPEPRIALDQFDARVRWKVAGEQVSVELQKVGFANADIAGSVEGRYATRPQSAGDIDISGNFQRGKVSEVWRYLPFVVGESVREWIRASLVDGQGSNIRLRMKGDLHEFPWAHDKNGEFDVSAAFSGARLHYAPQWPALHDIVGDLRFHGERMTIRARRANFGALAVKDASAEIADLTVHDDARLQVKGQVDGATGDFLGFVNNSPVAAMINDVTRGVSASGAGTLALALDLPLQHLHDTRVSGNYQFAGNELVAAPGLPTITAAGGRLEFTERSLGIRNATARIFGAPIEVSARTEADGSTRIDLSGSAGIADLRRVVDTPWLDHLSGSTPWQATVSMRGQNAVLSIESSLQGITSSLPEPLNKPAGSAMPLRVEFGKLAGGAPGADETHLTLDNLVDVRVQRRRDGERMVVERGGIGIRQAAAMAERGLVVNGTLDSLDLDAWRRLVVPGGDVTAGTSPPLQLSALALRSGKLTAFGQHFTGFTIAATQAEGTWQARIDSKEMAGDLAWRASERGRLRARLKNLSLSEVRSTPEPLPARDAKHDESLQELPGLDVIADNFSLRGKQLGKLELVAVNRGNLWQVDHYSIVNPDGGVSGSGQWHMSDGPQHPSETEISFKLQSANAGKLLERFGYEDAVKRASTRLEGKLAWRGAPTGIDYPSLTGEMKLEASSGQFNKLEPGVGRLLGVLSLQSLPRRITLDFRDVFSDGFAFDSISGSMKVTSGVLRTDDLSIRGPSAKVFMSGSTDLAAETQDLRVKVQPTLSESVALGAAIAGPVAGVATLLAQKVLKDPIEKLFSYEYGVSGTWKDPQVVKLADLRQQPAPAEIVR